MVKPPAMPGQRRIKRAESGEWRRLAPPDPEAVIPPIPSPYPRRRWTVEAHRAWDAWWSSPMACQWIEADVIAVRRALRLLDASVRGVPGSHAALTALEDRLGLTPKARRYLQWEARPITTPAPVVALAPRSVDPRERS
jgi:hypothetical protein